MEINQKWSSKSTKDGERIVLGISKNVEDDVLRANIYNWLKNTFGNGTIMTPGEDGSCLLTTTWSWVVFEKEDEIHFCFLFDKDKITFEDRWVKMFHIYYPLPYDISYEYEYEIMEWIKRNEKFPLISNHYLSFFKVTDAIHFKMKWC